VEVLVDGEWNQIDPGEPFGNIGYKRILRFPTVEAKAIRVGINESRGPLCINNIEAYFVNR
jgi:alpha-L-fucosidase